MNGFEPEAYLILGTCASATAAAAAVAAGPNSTANRSLDCPEAHAHSPG